MEPRKTSISLQYNGKNASKEISDYLENFSYNDIASGESDSITINLINIDKKWMSNWMPKKGDKLLPKIIINNWDSNNDKYSFKCGEFTVDDFSLSGRPLKCEINAVSIPVEESFKSRERTKTWKDASIETIAAEIAKRATISLIYEADKITIKKIEQSHQTDCDFLCNLCETYGLAMKVYSKKIIIFNEADYEKKKIVATINETDIIKWEYNTTTAKTYTGGKLQYTDPTTKKDVIASVGDGKRILNVNERADSTKDAELKIKAKIYNANKKMTTMRITIKANPKIIASSNVNIRGLEKLDGKYAVDSVKHNIENGYTMSLDLRLVEYKTNKDSKDSKSSGNKYTIKSGDTLISISKKYLGVGSKYTEIYSLNKEVIEAAAKAHGKTSSNNGHWIFSGTVIIIP